MRLIARLVKPLCVTIFWGRAEMYNVTDGNSLQSLTRDIQPLVRDSKK